MAFTPGFVSEFPDQSLVADCVPASGLMLTNKVTHNKYPSSVAERERLQANMPDPTPDAKPGTEDEGANLNQLAAGILKLYGLPLTLSAGWASIASILTKTNMGVVVIGKYQELPAYIRQQGNQPSFDGLHAIYLQADGAGTLTIGDPLASHFYQHVALGDVRAYCESVGAAYLSGTEQPTVIGYRLVIPRAQTLTFWKVARFTHLLYGRRDVTFSRASGAPMRHGSPGFWAVAAGALEGYYLVYGRSQAFYIYAVYSDGSLKMVPSNA